MSRRRVGFPILVALLLLILLAFAPDLFWPSKKEAPSASSGVMAERARPAVQGRADSLLAQSSPLSGNEAGEPVIAESPLPTPLPTPLSPPGGYVQYFFGPDPRMVRVEFYFDRPMDQQSVGWALTMTPPVATMRTWQENKLIVETSRPLPPGQSYSVLISTEAKDTNGIPLAYEIRYDGYVERLSAQIAPPAVNDPGEPIRIGFNYPIDGESALEALRLEPAIPGQVNWDAKNKQIFIYPDPPLLANSDYTFSFVRELRDEDGKAVETPASQSLHTSAPFFHNDYGMQPHPALPMRLTFDRAMDAESVVGALSISPIVSVTHEWLDKTLILTPISNSFAANSTYEITLEPTATSAEGDLVMSSAYRIYLGTGQLTPLADFGMGPNVQVLLADGPRAIQYQTIAPEVAADFELYALTPNQFVDRYTKSFGVIGNSEPLQPVSLDESEQVAAWQEVSTSFIPGQRGTMMQRSTSLPADVAPGLYLLNMKMATTEAQLFVALTHHSVAIKKGNDELLAWLTNSDGEPTIGADTLLFDGAGAILASGTTDHEGLLTLLLEEQDAPMLLMAEIEGKDANGKSEVTIAGIAPQWGVRSSSWAWGWAPPRASQQRAYAVHLYSDRPIYQPGQSVYYKAIIRNDDDARLTLPDQDTPVGVRLRDGRNNIVRTVSDTPNAFGTIGGKFQLAEGAMVGPYWLELEIDGELHRYRFEVQEYRKPDFMVEVHTRMPENLNPAFSSGEVVTITADARYLWGEPLANARLTWQHFYMAPEFTQDWMPPTTLMGSTDSGLTTNDEGRVSFAIPASTFLASLSGYPEGGQWGVEVTLQDQSGQSVSASTPLHFAAAPEVVQVTAPAVQLIEQPFTVAITATKATGEALAEREFLISSAVEHSSGTGPGAPTNFITVTTDQAGHTQVGYTIDEVGFHYIYITEVREEDANSGGEANSQPLISATASVSVIDPQNVPGPGSIPYYPFYVSLDRDSYAPGDEATITILSRFAGPALITMERGTVRRSQRVELTPPMTVVTTTIRAEDAPNLFVTVNGWEATALISTPEARERMSIFAPDLSIPDAFLHSSITEIAVDVLDKGLLVTLEADQEQYAPGQEVTFTVKVTDEEGKPVEAELSLALVDEAIFMMANEQGASLFDAFYAPRPHTVDSYDSMAPTRYFNGGRGGGGGGGGGDYRLPRQDFRDTVAWLPNVVTDADGVAIVTMTLPDNLTTWRLTVKAITGESTQVGEAATSITTWQPLVVRPLLPRGLTVGDIATLSATLHNQSEVEQEATVWLELASTGVELGVQPTQTVALEPGEVRVIGWPVTATAAGGVSVTIAAITTGMDGESSLHDAVVSKLQINPLAISAHNTHVGEFGDLWETTVRVPEGVLPMSSLHIELNRSVAGSFVSGLEYLTGFPYGCVEQTMSRALPNAVVSRALHLLGMDASLLHPDLPGLVNASVQRLYGFQHQDGGWGWWYDDVSHDYQTAWVLYGLAMSAQSGYEVDTTVMARAIAWLFQQFTSMDDRTLAFALYSIALAAPLLPPDGMINGGEVYFQGSPRELIHPTAIDLAGRAEALDAFGLAALVLTLDAIGEEETTQAVMEWLLEDVTESEQEAHWEVATPDGHYEQKTMASSTRSTALALSALLQIEPANPLIPNVARWLMNQRQTQGWGSTNESAFALVALTDYLLVTEASEGTSEYIVQINGEEVASGMLDKANPTRTLSMPISELNVGENQVRLLHIGDDAIMNPLYYKVSEDFTVGQANLEAAGQISIERHYEDFESGERLTTVQAGELVRVVLNVSMPVNGYYMLIEDGVPGGLEPLNESLNTTSMNASTSEMPMGQEFGYNYKEIYGDRVRFFITELNANTHRFSYLARATHTGAFVALPTEVWGMYNPQLWGRSASQEIAVE